ncbi:phosphotransferase [Paenibacillus sp. FSL K6-3182]|uniref:phosphotransferase n=1 Tax=unclassified Paenibacillus TaxID=185978 RepID=UPI0030D0D16D
MNLQSLFSEPIMSQSTLGGFASDVFLVITEAGEYVVRSSGVDETVDAPFVWACSNLFGKQLSETFDMEIINQYLSRLTSNIAIPSVLGKAVIDGRQVISVEKINGIPLSFQNKSAMLMEDFGRSIAEIHSHKVKEWGSLNGSVRHALADFPQKLADALRVLAARYYKENTAIYESLNYYCSLAENMPVPEYAACIMLDMDPRQFLSNGERVSAIVDTEAYVLGPREMDLIAIECSLDEAGAHYFRKGYAEVLPFPDLLQVRELYRYFFCLLEIKGPAFDYHKWMSFPQLFGNFRNAEGSS